MQTQQPERASPAALRPPPPAIGTASDAPSPRMACSAAQRRFWLLDRMDPGNPALNIAMRWRLKAAVSGAALHQAFARVLARHPVLRIHIDEAGGEPVQITRTQMAFHIPDIDLTALPEPDALAEAERIAQLEARVSFDLSAPPLIRLTRLWMSQNDSILLLTVHRVVCDERSVEVLARELAALASPLPPGEADAHGARWRDTVSTQSVPHPGPSPGGRGENHESSLQFWNRALQGSRYFELYPDHPRSAAQTSNGSSVSLLLDRDLTRRLQDLSHLHECALSTTALATLFTLLHRYSGETDIVIGCEVSGRHGPGMENAVGLFANTLLRRGDLSGDPAFTQVLARTHDRVTVSHDHRQLPLGQLIELLKPKRDLSRSALFSVHFNFQEPLSDNRDYDGLPLEDFPPSCPGTRVDLNIAMIEGTHGWRLSCDYNTDLFERPTAEGLLNHFANLLRAVTTDAARTISSLPMLDDAQLQALNAENRRSAADYPQAMTMPALFEMQAQKTPEAVAVLCGEQRLSYRELDRASNRLARVLQSRGIGRAARVGICLDRSPDLVIALLAAAKSGAAYVPLDPAYPAARLAQIVEDAQPAVILTTQELRERLPAAATPRILLDTDAAMIGRQRDSPLASNAFPEDLAYVIYTSGSTGRPKGVQVRHQALTNLLWAMRRQPGLSAGDTWLSVTTVSFDIAALEIFLPLIVGAKLVVAQRDETADGAAMLRLLRRHHATVMQATPVTWQILLASGWGGDPPLKMLCGGEAMTRTLADQMLPFGELWNLYGPTETTIWSSALRVEPGTGPVPIGPPIANTQFHVLDAHGQRVPPGVPGELYIGGDGVAPGYQNLPQLTRERFVADPFSKNPAAKMYRSGDRVCRRPGGTLEFLGRGDGQIKLRGFRIELGEIESVLHAQAQVAECVVVATADAAGEYAIRAYVVARPAAASSAALVSTLRSSVRQALPAYMCPAQFVVLDALPRMPNGKVDRAALPLHAIVDQDADAPGAPLNDAQRRLAKIWSAVLGIPEVGADANFFEVGGHSLLAVRLLAQIEAELGCTLTLAALFKHPTLAEQAQLLDHRDPRSYDFRQVLKLQASGTRTPLIAVNNTGIYYVLSKRLGPDQPFTSLQLFDPSLPRASLPQTLEDIAAGYVQLIRRVQPDGPYALLGWCVAGTLAFEVARQITESGQRVSQLILFDTLIPGYLQRLPWLRRVLADYSYRAKLIAADWARLRQDPHRLATFLSNRTTVKALMRWPRGPAGKDAPSLAREQSLSPEHYDQWLLQYLEDAATSYQPKSYSGRMTLFRSSQEPMGRFLDPQMGWGDFVEGGIETVVIDGDHFSIFQEPGVSRIARHIDIAAAAEAGLVHG